MDTFLWMLGLAESKVLSNSVPTFYKWENWAQGDNLTHTINHTGISAGTEAVRCISYSSAVPCCFGSIFSEKS